MKHGKPHSSNFETEKSACRHTLTPEINIQIPNATGIYSMKNSDVEDILE